MVNSSSGSLDRAFEELIERVVQSSMASVRGELARIAESAGASAAVAPPAVTQTGGIEALHRNVNSILLPTSQTDILAAALKSSAEVARHAALFVRRGDSFTTWRSEGLSTEQVNNLKAVNASAAVNGPFKDLCDSLRSVSHPASSSVWPAGLGAIADGGASVCLLPVIVAAKVVAAIAASAGSHDAVASLEIIIRVAGLSLETSGSRAPASASALHPAAAPAATPATAPPPEVVPNAAPASPADTAAHVEGARGSFAEMGGSSVSPSTLPPPPDVEALPEPDKDSHKKAYRFARVAVQDLLSYHKSKIDEGRNNRNLYDVLREDIEKTRENYQKRFASTPASSFDYLHYEMVAKLAGNDLEVLGRNYPGPVGV